MSQVRRRSMRWADGSPAPAASGPTIRRILARTIHRTVAERVLRPDSSLIGAARANAIAGRPVVIVANHLSYSDANLLEVLLYRAGASTLADRLTAIAGPKVYPSLRRRFSSLCFGTVRTPQNSAL